MKKTSHNQKGTFKINNDENDVTIFLRIKKKFFSQNTIDEIIGGLKRFFAYFIPGIKVEYNKSRELVKRKTYETYTFEDKVRDAYIDFSGKQSVSNNKTTHIAHTKNNKPAPGDIIFQLNQESNYMMLDISCSDIMTLKKLADLLGPDLCYNKTDSGALRITTSLALGNIGLYWSSFNRNYAIDCGNDDTAKLLQSCLPQIFSRHHNKIVYLNQWMQNNRNSISCSPTPELLNAFKDYESHKSITQSSKSFDDTASQSSSATHSTMAKKILAQKNVKGDTDNRDQTEIGKR